MFQHRVWFGKQRKFKEHSKERENYIVSGKVRLGIRQGSGHMTIDDN